MDLSSQLLPHISTLAQAAGARRVVLFGSRRMTRRRRR